MQSKATTGVSLTDISNQTHIDGSNEGYTVASRSLPVSGRLKAKASLSQLVGARGSETDSASIRSYVPNTGASEVESIFDDFIPTEPGSGQPEKIGLLSLPEFQADDVYDDFASEFEPIGELAADGQNEGTFHSRRSEGLRADRRQRCFSKDGRQSENIISSSLPLVNLFGRDMATEV